MEHRRSRRARPIRHALLADDEWSHLCRSSNTPARSEMPALPWSISLPAPITPAPTTPIRNFAFNFHGFMVRSFRSARALAAPTIKQGLESPLLANPIYRALKPQCDFRLQRWCRRNGSAPWQAQSRGESREREHRSARSAIGTRARPTTRYVRRRAHSKSNNGCFVWKSTRANRNREGSPPMAALYK